MGHRHTLVKKTTLVCLLCSLAQTCMGFPSWDLFSSEPPSPKRSIPSANTSATNPRYAAADSPSQVWVIQDTYEGQTFFDTFDFFTQPDPTSGTVHFVDKETAFSSGLAYVTSANKVIMKGDSTTTLPMGVNRSSVRISSKAVYNTGLFVLDVDMAPWGCGVWPAFWTLGSGQWPYNGEIDIIEGVHDQQYNQVTWHTAPGCQLTPTSDFTGTIVQTNGVDNLECNGLINYNSGCGVTEWSHASYGPYFDSQGGGVFAMKWDANSIAVWSFYRAAIPQDIIQGLPNPANWPKPVAELLPTSCNITEYFANHSVVFDITFCGDWAGNSYATSGCPGTCPEVLMDPTNFVNATWIINSLKVYKSATIDAQTSAAFHLTPGNLMTLGWIFALATSWYSQTNML